MVSRHAKLRVEEEEEATFPGDNPNIETDIEIGGRVWAGDYSFLDGGTLREYRTNEDDHKLMGKVEGDNDG